MSKLLNLILIFTFFTLEGRRLAETGQLSPVNDKKFVSLVPATSIFNGGIVPTIEEAPLS
jgi:hypothetical protein